MGCISNNSLGGGSRAAHQGEIISLKRPAIITLALAAALLALLAVPLTAGAYCVYNHSDSDFQVRGDNCLHCLKAIVRSGEKACCPGGDKGCRGHTSILLSIRFPSGNLCNNFYVPHKVEAHGWVSLFGSCSDNFHTCNWCNSCAKLRVKVHDKHGKVVYEGGARQAD